MWSTPSQAGREFVEKGFCIVQADDTAAIRKALVQALIKHVPNTQSLDEESYLNRFHEFVDPSKLNAIRLDVYRSVGGNEGFRRLVFKSVQKHLQELIGTEIVMQRAVNFVIQRPNDPTGLLYLHTDSWSGCSPYEVILWMPLVNVYDTKSMYICELGPNRKHLKDLKDGCALDSAVDLMKKVRPDIKPLKMDFGKALLFSPILLHGADENKTSETRFILNVRFKALFSPYGTKVLGETFAPVNYLPATEVGLNYESEFGIVGV